MTFDNSRRIISMRIKLFGVTVIFIAYLVLAFGAELIKFPLLGLNDIWWTTILAIIWIGFVLYPLFFNYQFFYYSDDDEKIVIRYFNAAIVGGRKNSLEIDKTSFLGYKTESRLFGLITSITLFRKINESTAKYPAVYTSALSGEEKDKLFRSLNYYSKK